MGDGTWYIDLNGNGVFDPDNTDPTSRDIVWKFGSKGDLPVTGDYVRVTVYVPVTELTPNLLMACGLDMSDRFVSNTTTFRHEL